MPKLLVAVALAVLAAACASPESVRKDDALVVLLPRAPESLDPRHVFDAYGLRLSRLVFASLVTIDPATLAPIPDLAERVEFLSPTEVRVVLRAGLRFSDGSALDSADVKATFDAVRDPAVKSRYARTYARVRSIDTPDALTVLFHLDGPHAPFLTDLELPVLRAEDARGPALRAAPGALVGAGPFRLLSASGSELDFAHNPHWHGGAVRAPHVRFIVVRDDNTRAMRLRAGGADLLLGAVPPLLLPLFSDATRFSIERAPGIGTSYVGINVEHPRLADVRVRRAIQLAIDRDALIEAKLAGYGESTDSWFPAGHWAASVDAAGAPTFDPDQSRRLLDEAGLGDPDGTGPLPRTRFVLRTSTDRSRTSVCFAIAAMLRSVGLEVDVQPTETASLLADLGKGRFELVFLTVPEFLEPHLLSWFFASDRIPGRSGEGANRWRYRSEELDRAFERGRTESDLGKRRDAYLEANAILRRDLPVIPLWHEDVILVRRTTAPRFQIPRDGRFGFLAR